MPFLHRATTVANPNHNCGEPSSQLWRERKMPPSRQQTNPLPGGGETERGVVSGKDGEGLGIGNIFL